MSHVTEGGPQYLRIQLVMKSVFMFNVPELARSCMQKRIDTMPNG